MAVLFQITEDLINGLVPDDTVPSRKGKVRMSTDLDVDWHSEADIDAAKERMDGPYPFELFDDDRELYYRGQIWFAGEPGEEEDVFLPLEWGTYDAGCTYVRYPGHPEWDCG